MVILGTARGQRLEELEIIDVDRMRPSQLAADHGSGLRDAASGPIAGVAHHRVGRDVAELGVEIAVIGAAPELAVGRELEPEPRLQRHRLLDRAVLGARQLLLVDLAAVEFWRSASSPAGRSRLPICSARNGGWMPMGPI